MLVYKGILTNKGKIVEEEKAVQYAKKEICNDEKIFNEFLEYGYNLNEDDDIIEYFFSGDWLEEEIDEDLI